MPPPPWWLARSVFGFSPPLFPEVIFFWRDRGPFLFALILISMAEAPFLYSHDVA